MQIQVRVVPCEDAVFVLTECIGGQGWDTTPAGGDSWDTGGTDAAPGDSWGGNGDAKPDAGGTGDDGCRM